MHNQSAVPVAGRYAILQQVGQGGAATVFQALDMQTHQKVVLKFLNLPQHGPDEVRQLALDRFRQEHQILRLLDHPHIVQVLDYLEGDDQYCLVIEWIDGVTLDDYMRVNPPMPASVLPMMDQACEALEYMHARGIIHRDIKPENIMITAEGNIKILDFGLARLMGQSDGESGLGGMAGTVAYMAPELLKNQNSTDPQSDLYALGVTFYELLTGRVPYPGEDPGSTIYAIMNQDPPPPIDFNPMIGADLNQLVLTCIHKLPQHRFAHSRQLQQLLRILAKRVFYAGADPMLAMQSVLPPLHSFTHFGLVDELHNAVHRHENGQFLVWNASEQGGIWMQNGNILHADIKNKNLDSLEILMTILSWESGNFMHIASAQVPQTTIRQNAFKLIEQADAYLVEYKMLWEMYRDIDILEQIMRPGVHDNLPELSLYIIDVLSTPKRVGELAAELPISRRQLLESIKALEDRQFIFVERER